MKTTSFLKDIIFRLVALSVVAVATVVPVKAQIIARQDTAAIQRRAQLENEKVIVGEDTIPIILPERNWGRYDRGLYNFLFMPKGHWAFGITASYGEITTDDLQLLSMISDISLKGKMYSINPSVSYFIRHNQSIGLKLSYSRGTADLERLSADFDDDLNFDIHDVSYVNETYALGTFYRNYVGLGRDHRFSVFNEVDLMFQTGASRFNRLYNDQPRDTRTTITQASLNFSPGVAVFIMENVAFNVSFGVFGLKVRHESQVTNGVDEGSRTTSGANFRFNIFNINFGLLVVI